MSLNDLLTNWGFLGLKEWIIRNSSKLFLKMHFFQNCHLMTFDLEKVCSTPRIGGNFWHIITHIVNNKRVKFRFITKYCSVVLATLILSIISFQHKISYYAFYLNKFLFTPFNLRPCLFYTDSKWTLNELGFSGLKEWIIWNYFKTFFKKCIFFKNCTWWPLTLKKSMFHTSDWWKLLVYGT